MRPNPDSPAHQQAAAADTKEGPAVAVMAAGTVAWQQAVVAVRFTSPTSVASLSYLKLANLSWTSYIDWALAPLYYRMAGSKGLVPSGW